MTSIDTLKAEQADRLKERTADVDYDFENKDGDKIVEIVMFKEGKNVKKKKVNLSTLTQCAPSTTDDVHILVTEARLADDGTLGDNPHFPESDEVREQAEKRIEANGHVPAWLHGDTDD